MITDRADTPAFGGIWTLLKVDMLRQYLVQYVKVFKNQKSRFSTVYIDAFAGAGEWQSKQGEISHDGSARVALECVPPFDRYHFIDMDSEHVKQLRALSDQHPDKEIQVEQGDANVKIGELLNNYDWNQTRGVIFLDPFSMELGWDVLPKIANTRGLDVWYLFPLSAVLRQLANDKSRIDEHKRNKLIYVLGTEEWDHDLYTPTQSDLFGADVEKRAHHDEVNDWFRKRLNGIFGAVAEPRVLRDKNNSPLFTLFFCVSSRSGPAIGAATRIANHILKNA